MSGHVLCFGLIKDNDRIIIFGWSFPLTQSDGLWEGNVLVSGSIGISFSVAPRGVGTGFAQSGYL